MSKTKFELSLTPRGSYRKKETGNMVFRYMVTGPKVGMEAYEEVQGDYFIEDDESGEVLYFTGRAVVPGSKLVVNTETEKIYVDDSEIQAQASIAAQLGGNLGEAIAKEMAAKAMGGSVSAPTPSAPQAPDAVDEPAAESNLEKS